MKRVVAALSAVTAVGALVLPAGSAAPTSLLVETPGNAEQHALPSVESAMGSERFHRTSRLALNLASAADALQSQVQTLMEDETRFLAAERAELAQKISLAENATDALALKNKELSGQVTDLTASNAALQESLRKAHTAMETAFSGMTGDKSKDSAEADDGQASAEEQEENEEVGVDADDADTDGDAEGDSGPVSFLAVGEATGAEMGTGARAVASLMDVFMGKSSTAKQGQHSVQEAHKAMLQEAHQLATGIADVIATVQDTEKTLQKEFDTIMASLNRKKSALEAENLRLQVQQKSLLKEHDRLARFVQQVTQSLQSR
mmetsp:Transcript_13077/g.29730  ORF Transcript_13077/g.29730 Transcript_13077/m.29730 type:complete len:320 (-) Transcript_13077:44-1003(-)